MKNKKLWDEEEDKLLVGMIKKFNTGNWKKISSMLKTDFSLLRTPKQCRDRWFNNLKNDNNSTPFSKIEVSETLALFEKFGPKWSKISNQLSNRTENQVKNFLNATIRRNVRRFNKGKSDSERIPFATVELLRVPEIKNMLLSEKSKKRSWFSDIKLDPKTLEKIRNLNEKPLETLEDRNEVLENSSYYWCINMMDFTQFNFIEYWRSHLNLNQPFS